MRILILTNSIIGLTRFRYEFIEELSKEQQVYISVPDLADYEDTYNKINVKLHKTPINRRGMNPIKDFFIIKSYVKLIRKIKPDKIVTYTVKPNIYGGMVARFMKIDHYSTITGLGTGFQSPFIETIVKKLYKFSHKKTRKVFFQNQHNLDYFINKKLINLKSATLVPGSGVNVDRNNFIKRDFSESLNVLFAGRIMKEKGIELFLKLAKEFSSKEINFFVAGDFESENYVDIINDLHQKEIISYLGYVKEMNVLYENTHILINPSHSEGMSNVLLESSLSGCLTLASNIPGCKEILNNNEELLFDLKNYYDLRDKFIRLLNLHPHEKVELGKKNSKFVKEYFDRNKVVQTYIKIIGGENVI